MNVSVNPSVLLLGMDELTLSADADYAIATLSMNGEVLASGYVENGQCTLHFPALSDVGEADLVVLGFNKVTYIGQIEVVPAEGAYISVNNYEMNHDQAEYVETIDLSINVKNVGVEIASNLTAILTTECEYVDILADEATLVEINPDEIVTLEGYQFHVAENVPDGTVAQFFLNVTDGTNEWQGKFNITLHAPVIALSSISSNDETLTCGFINNGSAPFHGGVFNVYSSSSDLVFTEPSVTFEETIEPGAILTVNSEFTVAETVALGTTFEIAYDFISGFQFVEGEYNLNYGAIMEDFESGAFGEGWTHSAQYAWTVVAEGRDGYCAKSSNANVGSSEGYCQLTVDVQAAGELTFWYKVSSENNWDKLHFYMDGTDLAQWSGNVAWTQHSQPVTAGTHTFKWSYTKDYSVNSGSDCAWIDDIKFPPVDVVSFIAPVNHLNAFVEGMTVNLTWSASDAESFVIKRNEETVAEITETDYAEYVNEGVYKYSVFAKKGDDLSQPSTVVVMVEYDATGEANETVIGIYPNPVTNVLNIVAGDNEFEYQLFNGMGQEMAKGTAQGTQQINVSGMAKGIYFLRLTAGSQVTIEKIVVE